MAIRLRGILASISLNVFNLKSSSPVVSSVEAFVVVSSALEFHVHTGLLFRGSLGMVGSSVMRASMRSMGSSAMTGSLVVLVLLLGKLVVSVETKELLVLLLGPVTHEVHGDLVTIRVLLSVLLNELHFLGEDGESVLILLLGAIGFSVFGNVGDVFSFNLGLDLEEFGA